MREWRVLGTPNLVRARAKGEYVVCLTRKSRRELGVNRYAVVERDVSDSGGSTQTLRVLAKVLEVNEDEVEPDSILADQTCRNAIGIPFRHDPDAVRVRVRPARIPFRVRAASFLATIFGRKYAILRVHKGDIPDMEKRIARIRDHVFPVLGTTPGARIVIESVVEEEGRLVVRSVSVRAFELGEDTLTRMETYEQESFDARFPDAGKLLAIDPDIGDIYLDAYERTMLGVDSPQPVWVRRDIFDLLKRELLATSLLFFVSLFSFTSAVGSIDAWIAVVLAALIALAFAIVALRSRAE